MWCVRFIAVTLLFLLPIGSAGAAASPAASDGASLGLAALSADGGSADALTLVADGVAFAAVVIADDADEQTRQAALKLARYVKAATGATLPVLRESELATNRADAGAQVFVHVGRTQGLRPEALQALEGLDEDGFVIHAADGRIDIVGPSPWGTEFGVDEFLERYVGVRWLFPGPLGEDVPSVPHLAVPQELVRDEPAFISRVFSGLRGSVQAEWARNNRMRGRIQFHHNLHRLFPPAQYGQTHPEFYPLRHGRRVIPTGETGWQPCFTAPGIVEEAVKNIVAYFDANPQATSYSLGVNDSGGHCEAEPDHPDYPGALNSIGRVNMSEIYYAWVNQVVEGVLEKHPDKYFGLLAYSHVYDPPTGVKLHPRVIPYITDDRMTWADPVLGERGRELTRKWSEAAPGGLGWYEYLYGSPYMVPRFHVHQMAENYRFARANGAVAMYAELYPNWGEGPKPWISAKLQWNPDQDVDALLEEWYVRAVGEEAAPYLAAYYAHWEDFWTRRVFASDWYTSWRDGSSRSNYLPFHRPEYLQLVTAEEMAESRRLLEAVVEKARTQAQKARAELLLQAFEYYEASVLSYPRDEAAEPPQSEAEALELLGRIVVSLRAAGERLALADAYERDPVLIHPLPPRRYPNLVWDGLSGSAYLALHEWIAASPDGPKVRRRIEEIAENDPSAAVRGGVLYAELYRLARELQAPRIESLAEFERLAAAFLEYPARRARLDTEFAAVIAANLENVPPEPPRTAMLYLKNWADANGYQEQAKAFLQEVQRVYSGRPYALFARALLNTYR